MPFLPLYIQSLGVTGSNVELFSGIAFASTALVSGLVAPMWGKLADKYGRKPMMVRASFAMTFTMSAIAFSHQMGGYWWLLLMRSLMGFFSGFIPNSTAMIASQAPKER